MSEPNIQTEAERRNWPNREGYFWAAQSNYQWWNMIVKVYGEAPFFRMDVWFHVEGKVVRNVPIYDIDLFGPEMSGPEDAVEVAPEWKK